MSDWYWRVIALKTAFILTFYTCYLRADDTIQKLPFCNPHTAKDSSAANDLVLVSTLDGRLSAFDTIDGSKAWDIETKPLLSSNLHHVELTSGGKWVRLVPSLRGTLYSLTGNTVEPLPFDAEQLLSSSYKYSDDLVIAGSKEALWTGLDLQTGAVVYECGSSGCTGDQETEGRKLLVVRRQSSTVRALDPRSGHEKWNFSVGHHQLALSGRECGSPGSQTPDYVVAIALPDGMLAVKQPDSKLVLWQKKLDAPVAGLWRFKDGSLQHLDVLWAATKSLSLDTYIQSTPPSLYIGLHNQQLYIQENDNYIKKLNTAVSSKPTPWKLKHVRPLISGPDTALSLQNSDPNTLSLITLYGNTGQGGDQGYFLYSEETCDQAIQVTDEIIQEELDNKSNSDDSNEHYHIHAHVPSLWFWWKEVILIAISSALLLNMMIRPRFFAPKFQLIAPATATQLTKTYPVYEAPMPKPSQEYSGRYENDFTPLRCLGRGGFGVVFEAKNNIDHCSYAVKRITLPRKASKRERVLREVRALAKLEHEHIVRYFNAWLEEPPPNWQEQRDAVWMRELDGVSLTMTEDSYPKSSSVIKSIGDSVKLNLHKSSLDYNTLDYEGQLSEPSKRHRSRSCNDSFDIIFDENPSKYTSDTTKNTLSPYELSDIKKPPYLSKNLCSGDNDDSFIVFAHSQDVNHNSEGLSEARNDISYKQIDKVKNLEIESTHEKKKKKGHTRHWSLDLCVRSTTDDNARSLSKMYLYIQMQLCRRDSLHDWLRSNRSISDRGDKVKTLFSQIVSAVEYVHLAGLIHRDLKPSNIFFAPDGKVKVGDFGLVTAMGDSSQGEDPPEGFHVHTRHTYRVGTHLYMSPEQLRGRPYSYKVDIYSLGMILFELLQPFSTESERVACLLALRAGKFPGSFHSCNESELEVLKLMLSDDPSQRPTASGVRARAPLYEATDQKWHFTLPNYSS